MITRNFLILGSQLFPVIDFLKSQRSMAWAQILISNGELAVNYHHALTFKTFRRSKTVFEISAIWLGWNFSGPGRLDLEILPSQPSRPGPEISNIGPELYQTTFQDL